ncbi:hypothetical protein MHU86_6535 [Fragilaria crotonensis]|nr:hypothetical protein MHU86_6535 [Fragilaria crotonensis]
MVEQGQLDLNAKHWWLVGREQEVTVLEQVVERAKLGSRELVFIEGPSGAGKASIVQYLSHGHKSLFGSGKFGANPNSPFCRHCQCLRRFCQMYLPKQDDERRSIE